jgi:hypothetical protein
LTAASEKTLAAETIVASVVHEGRTAWSDVSLTWIALGVAQTMKTRPSQMAQEAAMLVTRALPG